MLLGSSLDIGDIERKRRRFTQEEDESGFRL